MLGHLESMTQLLQEERDFYKRECELLRNMKEKSALMSPPTRERVMNYSMSFWETWTEGNHSYSLFHCKSFFFLMLIPFSLSWKNFLFVRRKCLQTDHVLGLLSRTCKLLSSRSKNSSKKKILWGFCGHLSEDISGDLTQPRARRFRLKLRKEQAKEVKRLIWEFLQWRHGSQSRAQLFKRWIGLPIG